MISSTIDLGNSAHRTQVARACKLIGLCTYEELVSLTPGGSLYRTDPILHTRWMIIWLFKMSKLPFLPVSYPEIAKALGVKSHSSVMAAWGKAKNPPGPVANTILSRFEAEAWNPQCTQAEANAAVKEIFG
jgi:hypothetical protein